VVPTYGATVSRTLDVVDAAIDLSTYDDVTSLDELDTQLLDAGFDAIEHTVHPGPGGIDHHASLAGLFGPVLRVANDAAVIRECGTDELGWHRQLGSQADCRFHDCTREERIVGLRVVVPVYRLEVVGEQPVEIAPGRARHSSEAHLLTQATQNRVQRETGANQQWAAARGVVDRDEERPKRNQVGRQFEE
jgi:hypothetical protein